MFPVGNRVLLRARLHMGADKRKRGKAQEVRKLLIQSKTSWVSTRLEYATLLQFGSTPHEVTPMTVSVPPRSTGPPESPKQVPPLP